MPCHADGQPARLCAGIDLLAPAPFKLAPCPTRSLLLSAHSSHRPESPVSQFYLDHSHRPVLAPATLAALPSTRAIADRAVFYVASPNRSILRSPHTALGIHQRAEI